MNNPVLAELKRRRRAMSLKERALLLMYFALVRILPDWLIVKVVARIAKKRPQDIGTERIQERIGRGLPPRPKGRVIWLHSIGPGDSTALVALIPRLLAEDPGLSCVVTTRTFAAQKTFAKLAVNPRVITILAPYDTTRIMTRFLDHWDIDLAVFCERDIWPVALNQLKRRSIPTAIVNGQLDGRLGNDLRKMPGLGRWMMGHIDLIHVFSDYCETDAPNWMRSDAEIVRFPNLKLDSAPLPVKPELLTRMRQRWGGNPVVTAASVTTREVPVLLHALERAGSEIPGLKMILAPRWKEQASEINEILISRGYAARHRSVEGEPATSDTVFIADSYGELGTWFTDSIAVFMGDSLFNGPGHNPYEPVLKGCKVIAGSHTTLFTADYKYLESLGLCQIAPDADAIAKEIVALAGVDGDAPGFDQVNSARGFSETLAARMLSLPHR